jgi:hypothetical protein
MDLKYDGNEIILQKDIFVGFSYFLFSIGYLRNVTGYPYIFNLLTYITVIITCIILISPLNYRFGLIVKHRIGDFVFKFVTIILTVLILLEINKIV